MELLLAPTDDDRMATNPVTPYTILGHETSLLLLLLLLPLLRLLLLLLLQTQIIHNRTPQLKLRSIPI